MDGLLIAACTAPPPSAQPPALDLTPADVAGLAEALAIYQAQFAPCFRRAEQRHWAGKYLEGQLAPIPRKSIEPMALALAGGNVQAMQQFIGEGAWDDEAVLARHQRLVADTLGDAPTGVLILDGCDFPKQGADSVGVARQWCGALGKRANCQASVLAAYASRHGYTLVDRRLYLPAAWLTDAYAARRRACGVPASVRFQTKPELAWELVAARQRAALPFSWVTMDEGFGRNTALLDRIAGAGLGYLAEVPHDTPVWAERPPAPPPPADPPPDRLQACLVDRPPVPERVDALAARVPAGAWRAVQIKDGSKGPLRVRVARLRVVAVRDGLPGPDLWLVLRRGPEPGAELKTYLSNAPAEVPEARLVWLLGMRWPIEVAIRECKDELGLDHYEVRGWRGWHHHLTMTLLAHHFLVWQRGTLGGKSAGADRAPSPPAAGSRPPTAPAGRRDRFAPGMAPAVPELRRRHGPPPPPSTPRLFLTT